MATADVYRLRVQLESVGGRAESERFIESKKKRPLKTERCLGPSPSSSRSFGLVLEPL